MRRWSIWGAELGDLGAGFVGGALGAGALVEDLVAFLVGCALEPVAREMCRR